MPALKTKSTNPYKPTDRVRASQSFGTATGTVREGDVFRGDDPIVVEHWPWFQPVDVPTHERKTIWTEAPGPPDHPAGDPSITIHTNSLAHVSPHRLVRATRSFWFDRGWAPGSPGEKSGKISGFWWGINVGQLVEVSSPVVAAHPESFEFPARTCTREDVERLAREGVN
jgi:hypothetical protein